MAEMERGEATAGEHSPRPVKRLVYVLPIALLALLGLVFVFGLSRDPRDVPSVMIDKPMPEFDLPRIDAGGPVPGERLTSAELKGSVVLVNFFASWCVPCRVEHPLLKSLAGSGVKVFGISWKDKPEASAAFLSELGDPYAKVGADEDRRIGFNFGVYGVPETFVIDRAGHIRHRHAGPLTDAALRQTILPMLSELAR